MVGLPFVFIMFNIIGYLGSFTIILSYYLFSSKKLSLLNYYYLNALGCTLSIIFALLVFNGPMLFVNIAIFVIGIIGIKNSKSGSL